MIDMRAVAISLAICLALACGVFCQRAESAGDDAGAFRPAKKKSGDAKASRPAKKKSGDAKASRSAKKKKRKKSDLADTLKKIKNMPPPPAVERAGPVTGSAGSSKDAAWPPKGYHRSRKKPLKQILYPDGIFRTSRHLSPEGFILNDKSKLRPEQGRQVFVDGSNRRILPYRNQKPIPLRKYRLDAFVSTVVGRRPPGVFGDEDGIYTYKQGFALDVGEPELSYIDNPDLPPFAMVESHGSYDKAERIWRSARHEAREGSWVFRRPPLVDPETGEEVISPIN